MPQPQSFLDASPAMTAAATASGTDRKALVVIYLGGGADAHNTVIPRTGANRTAYNNARPNLTIADNPATALDANWQLHPNLTFMKTLWDANKLAIVRNIGPLVFPMTKAQYNDFSIQRPFQLFSHSDQNTLWQTGISDQPASQTGWLGRMMELLIPFNPDPLISPIQTMAGPQTSQRGFDLRTLGLKSTGLPDRNASFRVASNIISFAENQYQTFTSTNPLIQEPVDAQKRSVAATALVQNTLSATTITTPFNGDALSQQLRSVIRMINGQSSLQQRRSVYWVTHGGYDQHANLIGDLAGRYASLGPALQSAYNATVELGIQNRVTFLVYTEFGRSLTQNGDGTDHAWGGYSFVFGGAVTGGYYGPEINLSLSGSNMVDVRGYVLPQLPFESLYSTLGKWMGVPDALSNGVNPRDLMSPNLPRFTVRDLGFL